VVEVMEVVGRERYHPGHAEAARRVHGFDPALVAVLEIAAVSNPGLSTSSIRAPISSVVGFVTSARTDAAKRYVCPFITANSVSPLGMAKFLIKRSELVR